MSDIFSWNENTKTLILGPEADLSDLKRDEIRSFPWDPYKSTVRHLVFEEIICIGSYHFSNLPNLLSITLPPSLREIHHHAFFSCEHLSRVDLPRDYILKSFYDPTPVFAQTIRYGLSAFKFTPFLEDYQGRCLIKDTALISVNTAHDRYIIPEGITYIHPLAFEDVSPKVVYLPASIKDLDPITFAIQEPKVVIFKNPDSLIQQDNEKDIKAKKLTSIYSLKAEMIPGSSLRKLTVNESREWKRYRDILEEDGDFDPELPSFWGHTRIYLSQAMLKRLNQGHMLILINKTEGKQFVYQVKDKNKHYLKRNFLDQTESILTLEDLLMELPHETDGALCHERKSLNPGSKDSWYQLSPLSTDQDVIFTLALL